MHRSLRTKSHVSPLCVPHWLAQEATGAAASRAGTSRPAQGPRAQAHRSLRGCARSPRGLAPPGLRPGVSMATAWAWQPALLGCTSPCPGCASVLAEPGAAGEWGEGGGGGCRRWGGRGSGRAGGAAGEAGVPGWGAAGEGRVRSGRAQQVRLGCGAGARSVGRQRKEGGATAGPHCLVRLLCQRLCISGLELEDQGVQPTRPGADGEIEAGAVGTRAQPPPRGEPAPSCLRFHYSHSVLRFFSPC